MRKIFSIIKTDFLQEFTYPLSWVFFLGLPIVFTIIIGVALGGAQAESSDAAPELPAILLVDLDHTDFSQSFLDQVQREDQYQYAMAADELTAASAKEKQEYAAELTIPSGFQEKSFNNIPVSINLALADGSFTSTAIENHINSALQHTLAPLTAARAGAMLTEGRPFSTDTDNQAMFMDDVSNAREFLNDPIFQLTVHEKPRQDSTDQFLNGFSQSSAGQLVTWSLITLLGSSVIFAQERENGTFQRLMTTPTTRRTYFIGKLMSRLLMGVIQMVILVLFGMFVLHVNWGNSPLSLIVFLTSFSFAGTAFGLMLGSFAKTSRQADALTPVFSMLLASLGGAWWPLEITPPMYQTVVRAIPTTWAMLGFNGIITRGYTLSGVLPELAVLLGFGILFTTIGVLRMNRKG